MNAIRKTFYLAIAGCLTVNAGFSQAIKEPSFVSPNQASLGRFGDMPVSYHTGVPEINIPVFTVQQGDLSVPISLNYHSSGVQVDDVSSWIGLGWSLPAGGSITRTIIGGPDEAKTVTYTGGSDCGYRGWYKDYGIASCLTLDASNCGSTNQGDGRGAGGGSGTCYAKYMAASRGTIDSEPDMYSFSFPGGAGKFFFDTQRKAHVIPMKGDFHIQPVQVGSNLFGTWKILGPDGTKYFFGGTGATENTYSGPNASTPSDDNRTGTTWYLTKIESANGEDWIAFEYTAEQYSYGTKSSHTYIRGSTGEIGSYSQTTGLTLTMVDGYRLNKITTSSGHTVVDFLVPTGAREDITAYQNAFAANTNAKALEKIQVTTGNTCRHFVLTQGYFSSDRTNPFGVTPETEYDAKRLKLVSFKEIVCNSAIINPPYQFIYNESAPMPRRYSFAQDHWGYHNGQSTNTVLIPPFTDPYNGQSRPGANRTPSETQMQTGILTRITYPTGGYTDFTYEAHRTFPSSTDLIGGLRIKSMVDNDGMGNSVTKNYNYVSGTLYTGTLSYDQHPTLNTNVWPTGFFDFGVIFNSSPNPPLQATHGYHIGYSNVEVSSPGNGKSVYQYLNTSPLVASFSAYPRTPTISMFGTGEILSESHSDASGNLKRSVQYTYGTTGDETIVTAKKISAVNCFSNNPGHNCEYPYPLFNVYTLSTKRHHLTQKVEYADGVTKTTTYTYDGTNKHNNAKSSEFTSSDGVVERTESVYPSDAGSGTPAAMYNPADANFKNMLSPVVEQRSYSNGGMTSKSTNQYSQRGTNVLLTSSKTYPTGTFSFIENQYEYGDDKRIINIYKSNAGAHTGLMWKYNGSLPVAEVKNAQNTQYTVYTNTTSTTSVLVQGTAPQVVNKTFTVAYNGTVTLKLGLTTNPSFATYVDYSWTHGSGTLPLTNNQSCGYNQVVFNDIPSGEYTMTLTVMATESGATVNACGEIQFPHVTSALTGTKEFFYHDFEEDIFTSGTAHTGKRYLTGDYSVSFTKPNARNYTVEYWYLNGNVWEHTSAAYTNGMTLSLGTAIDDVRVYPSDALMKSYTYDPGLGITSMIDENGKAMYYEYDTLGRLVRIKNDKGGIEKQYTYNYKTN